MLDFINEKFSTRAKSALQAAQKISRELGYSYVGTEHLLYGIISEISSFASKVLLKNKISNVLLRQELEKIRDQLFTTEEKVTMDLKQVLEKAAAVASKYQYQFVGTEHFLFGLVDDERTRAYSVLRNMNIDPREIRKNLLSIFENASKFPDSGLREQTKSLEDQGNPLSALSYFAVDLTERARAGSIDPLIGREDEVERLISILNRRNKNNPVLIGDPGVGKTAIVEGLALAIHQRKVPESLLGKRILALDLALMVAGSMFRGEFENRLKQVIEEIKDSNDVILFIDELHTLVGAGATTGSLDAANILKPALARGELRAIGATTNQEYHQHIESDPALERRFQPIHVKEPDPEETLAILRGLKSYYEAHHGIEITDEALEAAVKLSVRYLTDRFLPDKAIDLVDETAAFHKMRESKTGPKVTSKTIEQDLHNLSDQKKEAVWGQDFRRALSLKNQENFLKTYREHFLTSTIKREKTYAITGWHIAETVTRITGIPIHSLLKKDVERLTGLEKKLKKSLVGQDEALTVIASAIRRSRAGLSSPVRPWGSFMFLGPSGVGKTMLAKLLAREIFGDEKSLIRIDMSELMERHSVARLIGAPAGYVGYEEGGRLTETVKRRPYAVILFDEIEKAHPDVFNLLLAILEEGELTDASGKKVNFRNTILIMTSNLGLENFNKWAKGFGFGAGLVNGDTVKENVMAEVRGHFRPELLNRIDKIIVFEPLKKKHLLKIVTLELEKLGQQLAELGIKLEISRTVVNFLAQKSFDPVQGARLVRKTLQDLVEDAIARQLLEGSIKKDGTVNLSISKSNELVVKKSQ